jgi:Mn-dependent DtxR family transcriptional regulator
MLKKTRTSTEDYLLAIYTILGEKDSVRSIDIAEYMGYSKPSTSIAVAKLRDGGLINLDRYKFISLTDFGRIFAEQLYEKRNFFAALLVWAGIAPGDAAEEAHNMEHAVSYSAFEALREKLDSIYRNERVYTPTRKKR